MAMMLLASQGSMAAEGDILRLQQGAVVLTHTGQYDLDFPANALIDGTLDYFWASAQRNVRGFRPDSFIIELDRPYRIHRFAVDNAKNDEMYYPGISAREVRFSVSTRSSVGPWKPATIVEGRKYARAEVTLERPVDARWLKVDVLSNHGHELYTEISELEAYGEPLADKPILDVDPSGVYRTNYGLLMLQVEDERVEGCYELDKGYVHGSRTGRFFDVEWIEHRGEERGTALLALSSEGFLNGVWYENGKMAGVWFGNRLPGHETIGCDPVTAAAGVGFKSGAIADK